MKHEPTGRVTQKELRYGRDVKQTLALLNAMKLEYDGFELDLPPEQAMSAASITKAFLDKMNVRQPSEKFDLPEEILGKCMQAYYGGRSEVRTRDYFEIHTGKTLNLGREYNGKMLQPQTVSHVIWKHYLHPEDKSLSLDGKPCTPYPRGLLRRRPIKAVKPFNYIGKEIERRAQEGVDPSLLEHSGPIQYSVRKTANTRPADGALIQRASRSRKNCLGASLESGASQHAVDRFFRGASIHPATRKKQADAVDKLERERIE